MQTEELLNEHMLAEATLTAHLVDIVLKAGYSTSQINAILRNIVDKSVISEFWITDESGEVRYTNVPDIPFSFTSDLSGNEQARDFVPLLSGSTDRVVQSVMARSIDGQSFKYVAVGGVDRARIVQIGIAEKELHSTDD